MLKLNRAQIIKLSDLFMDIAKGSYLASLAVPILANADVLVFLKLAISGIVCMYFSLKLLELEEVNQ